jgi:hypothetical protein
MRRGAADAIRNPPDLALIAHVPAATLRRAVPIELEKPGPITEPDPSEGATIELASGRHVAIIFGLITERIYIYARTPTQWPLWPTFFENRKLARRRSSGWILVFQQSQPRPVSN